MMISLVTSNTNIKTYVNDNAPNMKAAFKNISGWKGFAKHELGNALKKTLTTKKKDE